MINFKPIFGKIVRSLPLSPLRVKILLHCYCMDEPWENKSDAFELTVEEFVEQGVLVVDASSGSGYRTTKLGDAWVHAILRTPIPRMVFVDENGKEILPV